MTSIFISHAKEDTGCAEEIRRELEAKGYTARREPAALSLTSALYPRTIENAIIGSAIVVLLWSTYAVQVEWVERQTLFAQRLRKPVIPVLLDETELPNTLVPAATITHQLSCTGVVASLVSLPGFPLPDRNDPLFVLWALASHDPITSVSKRKTAIDDAARMLGRGEHREEVLALLEYLARDFMPGVQKKARAVLSIEEAKALPLSSPDQSRHIFPVRCTKCGHVSHFNKQRVCILKDARWRGREERAGKELDVLVLTCEKCNEEMFVRVDCEGYK